MLRAWPPWAMLAVLIVAAAAIVGAMRQTSTTFDEIFMVASGARGFETGGFDMTLDHPPVMQYLYGLPVFLSGPDYPAEAEDRSSADRRFEYARLFFWEVGNDPERIAFIARLVAAALAVLLAGLVFLFTARRFGAPAGLLAGTLVAFLPDVLAHGGVAYNDVPLALAFLLGVWAIDEAARRPTPGRAALAGAATAFALGVKFSAVALAPVAAVVLGLEAVARRGDRRWRRRVARAVPLALVAGYLGLVLIYRGDLLLGEFRSGLTHGVRHASVGHEIPVMFFGEHSLEGFWYFYPVAFLLKTPAALHLLMALAVVGFVRAGTRAGAAAGGGTGAGAGAGGGTRAGAGAGARAGHLRWATSPLRGPAVGALVFLAFILQADLNIGFRHALPLLPLGCIVVAVGVARLWTDVVPRGRARVARALRVAIVALVLAYTASSLSYYPHFLAYLSEYVPSRDAAYEIMVDSNLDWGQGLLALRDFMREEGVDRVYLSYFGSALPHGYGIDYAPLASYFPLPPRPTAPEPEYAAISATNLVGTYLDGDPFALFRDLEPYRVLAHTIYVYRVPERP